MIQNSGRGLSAVRKLLIQVTSHPLRTQSQRTSDRERLASPTTLLCHVLPRLSDVVYKSDQDHPVLLLLFAHVMASKYSALRASENCNHSLLVGTTELEEFPRRTICVDVSFHNAIPDQGRLHSVLRKLSTKRLKNQQASLKASRDEAQLALNDDKSYACRLGSQEKLVTTTEMLGTKDFRS